MTKKLYVGNLSYGLTEQSLSNGFSSYGTVVSARIITDRDTGRSKGFGFVEMGSEEEAQEAIAGMNGKEFEGRTINVSEAREQAPRTGGGGGRDGGRGPRRF
ncbi:MAG: RNA-binding protein [Bdellovibrio sp.]